MKWGNTFISILVADDFAEWRVGVRSLLRVRPEWQVIAEACDGVEAVRSTEEMHPHVVLLDVGMPILNGIEAAKQIRQVSPDSKIIFVTQANAANELLPAVEAALRDHPRATALSVAQQEKCRS